MEIVSNECLLMSFLGKKPLPIKTCHLPAQVDLKPTDQQQLGHDQVSDVDRSVQVT